MAAEIRAAGGEAHALAADVGDKERRSTASPARPRRWSARSTSLVHNASTLGPTPLRLLLDTDCEDLARVLEINLVGPFRLTKAVAGLDGRCAARGLVVHVSSDAAVTAYPRWGAYGVSKAALDHLPDLGRGARGHAACASSPSTRARWTPRCTRTAMPEADRATLADPRRWPRRIAAR